MCSYIKTSRHPRHCPRSNTPLSVYRHTTDVSVNVFGNGVRVHASTPRHVRTGFAASPQTACLRFFQTGLKSKSFYLSERAELSNKRLSFSATSVSFRSLPIRKRIVPRPLLRVSKKHTTLHGAILFFFSWREMVLRGENNPCRKS